MIDIKMQEEAEIPRGESVCDGRPLANPQRVRIKIRYKINL